MIQATQLRPGMAVLHDGSLCRVMTVQHVTPGNLRGFVQAKDHILLPVAGSIEDADARLGDRIGRDFLDAVLAAVPDDWLSEPRVDYVDYLVTRLEAPRPFVAEVEHARTAA